jgi:RND family efflux transporter MFP subunit
VQGNQASYSALSATSSGIVTAVEAEVGAVLSAGSPVVRVAQDGPRDAVFSVPEDMVDLLRSLVGRPGAIGVKTWGSRSAMPGTVREIGASADAVTRTFLVKVDIGQANVQLGQTASASLVLPRLEGITRLPLSAMLESKGRTVVWILDAKSATVRSRAIKVAGAEGNEVVVSEGLEPGDIVVTAGVHVLTEGQQVKPLAPLAAAGTASSAVGR